MSWARSKSSGPGILCLSLAGEKSLSFLPGWEISVTEVWNRKSCFNSESNTEHSHPPQRSVVNTSLWCYLLNNVYQGLKEVPAESPETLTSTTKSWKMLLNEPQIHQAKAGCFRSGRRDRRNWFSRKHSALPFLPTSPLWKPGMSWFTYADLSHCYQVALQHVHAHPPYLI